MLLVLPLCTAAYGSALYSNAFGPRQRIQKRAFDREPPGHQQPLIDFSLVISGFSPLGDTFSPGPYLATPLGGGAGGLCLYVAAWQRQGPTARWQRDRDLLE